MDFGKGKWYLDSGATKHVTPDKRVFEKLEVVEGSSIQTAGGQSLSVKGKGHVSANGIKFGEVLYVPGLTKSLHSVGSIADDGCKLLFNSGQMHILKDFDLADTSCIVAFGSRDNYNGLYLLGSPQDEYLNLSESLCKPDQLWHCRLAEPYNFLLNRTHPH